jgi:hypothetical protein
MEAEHPRNHENKLRNAAARDRRNRMKRDLASRAHDLQASQLSGLVQGI